MIPIEIDYVSYQIVSTTAYFDDPNLDVNLASDSLKQLKDDPWSFAFPCRNDLIKAVGISNIIEQWKKSAGFEEKNLAVGETLEKDVNAIFDNEDAYLALAEGRRCKVRGVLIKLVIRRIQELLPLSSGVRYSSPENPIADLAEAVFALGGSKSIKISVSRKSHQ